MFNLGSISQKIAALSNETEELTEKINRIEDKLKNYDFIKGSIMSRMAFKAKTGAPAPKELSDNWYYVAKKTKAARKATNALEEEKERLRREQQKLRYSLRLYVEGKYHTDPLKESNAEVEKFLSELT